MRDQRQPDSDEALFVAYLREVDILLAGLPVELREEIQRELLAHLEDAAAEAGISPRDPDLQARVIENLGSSLALGNGLYEVHRGGYSMLKRIIDICLATFCLIVCSPVFLILALLIKIGTPGPIIYKDLRIGRNRRRYHLYKFRSMTIAQPQHVTPIGRFMRRYSIDELPQLWNVLKGEMSLVGPRPTVEADLDNPAWQRVLKNRPGLTGPTFVTGVRAYNPQRQLEENLRYVEQQSLAYDLRLIGQTIGVLRKGSKRAHNALMH